MKEFKNKKLRKMLIDKGLSPIQLAEKTNVTYQQVNRIMNGSSNGSITWWKKAAETLQVDITEIME